MINKKDYSLFQSTQCSVLYSFLYPANWQVREILEYGYEEVFIAGPRNKAGTFTTSLVVRVCLAIDQTPEEAARLFLSNYQSAFDCEVGGQALGMLCEREAREVEIVYSMGLPLYNINPRATRIRQRHIFLKHEDQLFELLYAASEEDYATWLEAFRIMVQTFCFVAETKEAMFRPFVAGAGAD